jgi:hypothetical protein
MFDIQAKVIAFMVFVNKKLQKIAENLIFTKLEVFWLILDAF